ncbi:unnamed protein product [Cuscuta epithymum]|uniref:Uncharacterized protein n=1 Tax=Cuscuta epithymum TaxID=186058 RepID=A0AAV0G553_9ASTE|nr:unnamed protein product [Cuscuta epithymum]
MRSEQRLFEAAGDTMTKAAEFILDAASPDRSDTHFGKVRWIIKMAETSDEANDDEMLYDYGERLKEAKHNFQRGSNCGVHDADVALDRLCRSDYADYMMMLLLLLADSAGQIMQIM